MRIKVNKSDLLNFFVVFLAILYRYIDMWSYSLNNHTEQSIGVILLIITVVCMIIFRLRVKKNHMNKIILAGIICIVMYLITKSTNFLILYLFVIAFSNDHDGDEKFLKYFFISSIFLFCVTLFLNSIGFLPNNIIVRIENGEYTYRSNLGFYGANSLFLCMYPIIVSFLALYYVDKKLTKKKILIFLTILVLSVYFYEKTDCRAGILSVFFVLTLCNCKKLYSYKITKFIAKYYYVIFLVISLFCALYFGNTTTTILNRLSSGRMYYWNYYIRNTGLSFFGTPAIQGIPLDNLYLHLLYVYGMVFTILYLFVIFIVSKKVLNSRKLIFIILSFAFYSFFENNISFSYNFLIVLQLLYFVNPKMKFLEIEEAYEKKEI